jgi:hypothetical protein
VLRHVIPTIETLCSGGEIEPFHMFPFVKEVPVEERSDSYYFQWLDMARLNYLMTKFSALMQIPIHQTPFSVALDIFPKSGQSQDCLQGFYGNYELFGIARALLALFLPTPLSFASLP